MVTGVVTQGTNHLQNAFISSYYFAYSFDDVMWVGYKDDDVLTEHPGNSDPWMTQTTLLQTPVQVSSIQSCMSSIPSSVSSIQPYTSSTPSPVRSMQPYTSSIQSCMSSTQSYISSIQSYVSSIQSFMSSISYTHLMYVVYVCCLSRPGM